MNKLSPEQRAQVLRLMVEGMSLRSITRITNVSRTTTLKLLADAGQAFSEYQDRTLRNLACKRVQVDETWCFCYAKAKNVPGAKAAPQGAGGAWTWIGIDADTKLAVSWFVGRRDADVAEEFLGDLLGRISGRFQLTSDGHLAYLAAVENLMTDQFDYAQLVKIYGPSSEGKGRYSPPVCLGAKKKRVFGNPDKKHISTSYVERLNLNIRMGNRRFTRLTNAFSKKLENHVHSISIYFMHYNFVRLHQTLKISPAMAAGVTPKLWEMSDMVKVLEDWELSQAHAA